MDNWYQICYTIITAHALCQHYLSCAISLSLSNFSSSLTLWYNHWLHFAYKCDVLWDRNFCLCLADHINVGSTHQTLISSLSVCVCVFVSLCCSLTNLSSSDEWEKQKVNEMEWLWTLSNGQKQLNKYSHFNQYQLNTINDALFLEHYAPGCVSWIHQSLNMTVTIDMINAVALRCQSKSHPSKFLPKTTSRSMFAMPKETLKCTSCYVHFGCVWIISLSTFLLIDWMNMMNDVHTALELLKMCCLWLLRRCRWFWMGWADQSVWLI